MTRGQSGTLRVIIYHSKTDAHETFFAPLPSIFPLPSRPANVYNRYPATTYVRVFAWSVFYQYPVNFPRSVADTHNWKWYPRCVKRDWRRPYAEQDRSLMWTRRIFRDLLVTQEGGFYTDWKNRTDQQSLAYHLINIFHFQTMNHNRSRIEICQNYKIRLRAAFRLVV